MSSFDVNKQRQEALSAVSDVRYRSLFDDNYDAVFLLDLNGNHIEANKRAAEMLGYTHEEIQTLTFREVSAQQQDSADVLAALLSGERVPPYERLFRKKSGETIPVEVNVQVVRDENNQPLYVQSMVRDISERKEAERTIHRLLKDQRLLLRELNHRMKNNLNSIHGLIEMERQTVDDLQAQEAFMRLAQRVTSVSLIYESLFVSDDFRSIDLSQYLKPLIERIRGSFDSPGNVVVQTRLDPVVICAEQASPLGIIVNELVTNAFKHAFPNGEDGVITVSCGSSDGGDVWLSVADTGTGLCGARSGVQELHRGPSAAGSTQDGPTPDTSDTSGFGNELVGSLVRQLGATVSRTTTTDHSVHPGTTVTVTVPSRTGT